MPDVWHGSLGATWYMLAACMEALAPRGTCSAFVMHRVVPGGTCLILTKGFSVADSAAAVVGGAVELVVAVVDHVARTDGIGSGSPATLHGLREALVAAKAAARGYLVERQVGLQAQVASLQHTPFIYHVLERHAHQQLQGYGELFAVGTSEQGYLLGLASGGVGDGPDGGVDDDLARLTFLLGVELLYGDDGLYFYHSDYGFCNYILSSASTSAEVVVVHFFDLRIESMAK